MSRAALLERLGAGDVRALARAITLLEQDPRALGALPLDPPAVAVTGLTGPPGAGKSTLAAALTGALRATGARVALLSVDPSSTFTGGALLGDRLRLAEHLLDDGVFIRSLAARGAIGGLARPVGAAIGLCAAAGFAEVLVETVGVGQSEIAVAQHADTVVLVLVPEAGDVVQAIKAGVMEIADVIVVNKGDRPGAREFASGVRRAVGLRADRGRRVPIVTASARTGSGIPAVLAAIQAHREHRGAAAEPSRRTTLVASELLGLAAGEYERRLMAALESEAGRAIVEDVVARRIDAAAGALALARSVP